LHCDFPSDNLPEESLPTRIRASRETIEKSLQGNWQEELLFDLKIALESYDHFQTQIAAYDEQIRQELKALPSQVDLQKRPLGAPRPPGPLRFGQATHFLKRLSWATPSMSGLRYSQIP
jgi:hypothetical protein